MLILSSGCHLLCPSLLIWEHRVLRSPLWPVIRALKIKTVELQNGKICRKASSFLIFQWPLEQRFNYHLKHGLNVHHKEEKCSFLIDNLTAPLLTELNRNFHSYRTCGHKSFNYQLQHHSYSRKKALRDVSMLEMRSGNRFTGWDSSFISDINSQCWIHREKGEQTGRGSRKAKAKVIRGPNKEVILQLFENLALQTTFLGQRKTP